MIPRRTFHILCTACLVTLFSLFSFVIPSAVSAADANRLQKFVDSGRLSKKVRQQIEETGKARAMVLFDVVDITTDIDRKQKARGLKYVDKALRMEMRDRFVSRRQNILSHLSVNKDHQVLSEYDHLPMFFLEVDEAALSSLLELPTVTVNEIKTYQTNLTESLGLINADQAHVLGFTGGGTSVAVLDTGVVYTLSAFGNCTAPGVPSSTCKVAYVNDFAPDDGDLDNVSRHGTNVSGIVVGVAPDTRILGLDVFNGDYTNDPYIVSAVNWVIANRDVYNITAVNMSFGDDVPNDTYCSDTMTAAISNLKINGIATAVASGNEGYLSALSSPACGADAISVGAVYDADLGGLSWSSGCTDYATSADKVTCFSNSSSYLKLLAPGALINAAGVTMGGTSQAAPHVAGAIAVLKGEEPSLTPGEVLTRLTATGVGVTDYRNSRVTPRLNLFAAVAAGGSGALIGTDPTGFVFDAIQNDPPPPPQTLTIRNDGSGSMAWSVNTEAPWLDLFPASGTDTGSVTVSVNDTSLSPGSYNATISISSGDASNSPHVVPVTLILGGSDFTDFMEDFETGNFSHLPWTFPNSPSWIIQSATVYGGNYAVQTPVLQNGGAYLTVAVNITEPGQLRFKVKTYTSEWKNNIRLLVDGINYGDQDYWYGNEDWREGISDVIQPGIHTIAWLYRQGTSPTLPGGEAAWLDDIVFPPFNLDFPDISITPESFNFGPVPTGTSSAPRTFTVSNNGDSDLVISNVSLPTTEAGNSQFRIQNDNCFGQSVAASGSCTLQVVYAPLIAGNTSGKFRVESNDLDTPVFDVSLVGTGLQYWTLAAVKEGSGSGTVSSSPAGISCGTDCSQSYAAGQVVTLSASPDGNSSFTGWAGGGCSGTGNCVVTMASDLAVTATFTMLPPVAGFAGTPATGNAPLIVTFADSSTNFPTSWAWGFGDGGTSVEQNPLHLFEQPGNYTVTLTAANASGSDDEIKTSYISAGTCPNPPVAVGAVYYDTIIEAYADPLTDTGDVLDLHGVSFTGDLVFGRDIDVVLSGGNNCEYTASTMGSKLSGSLTVSAGTVTVENLIIM